MIICTVIVWISAFLFNGVGYVNRNHILFVGLFLGFASQIMDIALLRKGTVWMNTIIDFIAAAFIVYFSQFILWGSRITITGAIYTAILLAAAEYLQHIYLVKNYGRARTE